MSLNIYLALKTKPEGNVDIETFVLAKVVLALKTSSTERYIFHLHVFFITLSCFNDFFSVASFLFLFFILAPLMFSKGGTVVRLLALLPHNKGVLRSLVKQLIVPLSFGDLTTCLKYSLHLTQHQLVKAQNPCVSWFLVSGFTVLVIYLFVW